MVHLYLFLITSTTALDNNASLWITHQIVSILLLFAAAVSARQDTYSHKSAVSSKDQESASDQVTSILVHPGPNGPRHVILSDDHQILSGREGYSSRAVDYRFPSGKYPSKDEFQHTAPPPLRQVTYGPARPVALRSGSQLYHHRFATSGGKPPHLKARENNKGLSEAIYKYSTYVKHGYGKDESKDVEKPYTSSREHEKPDYTYHEKDSYSQAPQHEGLSAYRTMYDDEETKFRQSIGDHYEDYEKNTDYSAEKTTKPLPFSKLYFTKEHSYIPIKSSVRYSSPAKAYSNPHNHYEDESHQDSGPSGFDDFKGGKVLPILARFYKQPIPVIQTHLPADNVGLYLQYYQPHRSDYEQEEFTNHFEQYPQEKSSSVSGTYHPSDSEWTPINAPSGAVPAKSYDIPAPDLSLGKTTTSIPSKVFRRGSENAAVVVGKSKQAVSNQHIQGNSEGVVSAVVRVKQ